jgi:hypothetical protein
VVDVVVLQGPDRLRVAARPVDQADELVHDDILDDRGAAGGRYAVKRTRPPLPQEPQRTGSSRATVIKSSGGPLNGPLTIVKGAFGHRLTNLTNSRTKCKN